MADLSDKMDTKHTEASTIHKDGSLVDEAKNAANAEQSMTLGQAIKTYPKAIGWSMLLSATLIMEGYDLALLGNLYASDQFNQKFGTYSAEKDSWNISAAWQSGLSNGARGT